MPHNLRQAVLTNDSPRGPAKGDAQSAEKNYVLGKVLVRILFIIEMIRWTGLAPWEFELPLSRPRATPRAPSTPTSPARSASGNPQCETLRHGALEPKPEAHNRLRSRPAPSLEVLEGLNPRAYQGRRRECPARLRSRQGMSSEGNQFRRLSPEWRVGSYALPYALP